MQQPFRKPASIHAAKLAINVKLIVLSVLNVCVLYFCICTCSAQLSMFHTERHSRNILIAIIIITLEDSTWCIWP